MSNIFETTEYVILNDHNLAETPPAPSGGFDPDTLTTSTTTPTDNDEIITKESSTWVRKAFSKVWDYIKSKLGISSSGSTSKYLNEKGQWATPPNDNTTYTLSADGSSVKLTPSSGSATTASLNDLINGLSTGSSTPVDADYYISQYSGGGTTTTTYHRRPVSALWAYIKNKIVGTGYTTITGTSSSHADLNTYKTAGFYTCAGNAISAYVDNQPITAGTAFNLIVVTFLNSATYVRQLYMNHNSNLIWTRYSTNSGSTWSTWGSDLLREGGTMSGRLTSAKPRKFLVTGSGTAGSTSSDSTPVYTPASWTYNTGITAADGDMITIKLPNGGHANGVWLSIDNGTVYKPVAINGSSKLTTHFGSGVYLTLQYEASSSISVYPKAGGTSASSVTGLWRVVNFYNTNTTYSVVSSSANGLAPKITNTANFLKGDGTWTMPTKANVGLGNVTNDKQLPIAGGTMTGQIKLASNGFRTNSDAGYSVNTDGNFQHLRSTNTDYWTIKNNAGTSAFSVYWETGEVVATTFNGNLVDSGWKNGKVDSLNANYYKKVGNIVFIEIYFTGTLTGNTWTTLFTLPSGYRPSKQSNNAMTFGPAGNYTGLVRADTNGNVSIFGGWSGSVQYGWGQLSFAV